MKCYYCGYELTYHETAYKIDGEVVCDDCIRTPEFSDITKEELNTASFINSEKGEKDYEDEE